MKTNEKYIFLSLKEFERDMKAAYNQASDDTVVVVMDGSEFICSIGGSMRDYEGEALDKLVDTAIKWRKGFTNGTRKFISVLDLDLVEAIEEYEKYHA